MAACLSPKGEWIYCVGEDRYDMKFMSLCFIGVPRLVQLFLVSKGKERVTLMKPW